MMKLFVLLLVVGLLGWLLWGRSRGGDAGKTGAAPPGKPAAGAGQQPAQAMVACAHCGVHLPRAEALADSAGRLFCSEAHRSSGPR